MRIAVTYENGEVFQHFGHSEQFKLYDVEDGKIRLRCNQINGQSKVWVTVMEQAGIDPATHTVSTTYFENVPSKMNKNTFGEPIGLTRGETYTAETDGYIVAGCGYTNADYLQVFVNGIWMVNMGAPMSGGSNSPNKFSIFIKKGMRYEFRGSDTSYGAFYPFE